MDCVLLAAGMGQRMENPIPKQFIHLAGKPIIVHSLETLDSIDFIDKIILIYNKNYKEDYLKILREYSIETEVILIEGGKSRQDSVYCGLKQVNSDRFLLHEASRPFIFKSIIDKLKEFDDPAVIPTIPVPFTVSEGDSYMTKSLERVNLKNIQLPQMFDTKILIDSHENASKENFIATEDGILVFKYGNKVKFIEGYENNIKITTPFDLIIAEHVIRRQ